MASDFEWFRLGLETVAKAREDQTLVLGSLDAGGRQLGNSGWSLEQVFQAGLSAWAAARSQN